MRRDQHGLERLLHAALEGLAVFLAQLVELHQPLDLRRRDRATISPTRERTDDLACKLRRGAGLGPLGENAPMRLRQHLRGGLGRAFDFEMVHVHPALLVFASLPLRGLFR